MKNLFILYFRKYNKIFYYWKWMWCSNRRW